MMHHPENDMMHHPEDTMLHPENDMPLHSEDDMQPHSEDDMPLHPDDMPLHPEDDIMLYLKDDMLHHPEDDTMLHPENGLLLHPEDNTMLHPEDDILLNPEATASVGADQSKFQIQLGCSHLLSTESLDMSTGYSWSPEMSDSGISSSGSPADLDFVNHQQNLFFYPSAKMDFGMSNYRQLPPGCPSDVVPYKLLCGLGHVNLTSNGEYSSRIMGNFVE